MGNAMRRFKIDFLESYDDDSIINELRRIAAETGKQTVTKADIESIGCMSYSVVNKHFGSLRMALQKAGLTPHRFMKPTNEELVEILIELWDRTLKSEGRRPYRKDLKDYGCLVSADTYYRRFGSWKRALLLAYDSITKDTAEVSSYVHPAMATSKSTSEEQQVHKALPLRKRFFIFKRDNFTCQICGRSGVRLEVDHIVPSSKGGSDSLDNLQTLCFECNRGKRDSYQS